MTYMKTWHCKDISFLNEESSVDKIISSYILYQPVKQFLHIIVCKNKKKRENTYREQCITFFPESGSGFFIWIEKNIYP